VQTTGLHRVILAHAWIRFHNAHDYVPGVILAHARIHFEVEQWIPDHFR
jgi:hypothetical protein